VPEQGNPSVRRRRLAAELRRLRERAGITGDKASERLGWSGSKLSRIENNKIGVKQEDLRLLLDLYRVGETHRSEVLALARESAEVAPAEDAAAASYPAPYAEFVHAEAEAIRLWTWEPQIVPGLLQTKSYAREVIRGWYEMFRLPPTDLEVRVGARITRQQLLTRKEPPELSAIIDESVIYRRFGDSSIMRDQLERLAEASEMPNVELRVLALGGHHPIGTGTFVYMQFSQKHDVPLHDIVSVEQLNSEHYIEDVTATNEYRVTFERLKSEALGTAESRDLIARTAREHWSHSKASNPT
jgi:transcriptional regulator with XRE-family HTH domain